MLILDISVEMFQSLKSKLDQKYHKSYTLTERVCILNNLFKKIF